MDGWAWVRPAEPSVLEGRPLLDLGVGDGQTLTALVGGPGLVVGRGLVVGVDRSAAALGAARRAGVRNVARAAADRLPFGEGAFEVVLAGDLFHHLCDEALRAVLDEVARVGRSLVAWWYEEPGRPAPDAPRYPRPYEEVADACRRSGLSPEPLELEMTLEPAPPTAGLLARTSGLDADGRGRGGIEAS